MFRKPILWFAFASAVLTLCGRSAEAQLEPEFTVDITEENGLFTYEYTVHNPIFSAGIVDAFLLSVAQGGEIGELTQPRGWVHHYAADEPNLQVAFVAGDGLTCVDKSDAIARGGSGSFTITSPYAPQDQLFLAAHLPNDCGLAMDFLAVWEGMLPAPSIEPIVTGPTCDLDGDGDCDLSDIDRLSAGIATESHPAGLDLTGDGLVDRDDLDAFLAHEKVNKLNGDSNFSGTVDFPDFLKLASNFQADGAVWSEGDFNANARVDFPDFLILATNFNKSSVAAASSVPEPTTAWLLALPLLGCGMLRRKANS